MEQFDFSYDPTAMGTLLTEGYNLFQIGVEEDVINMSPVECQKLVHLLLRLYREERTASVIGRSPDYLQRDTAKNYFINSKSERGRHRAQTNALLIGLVSANDSRLVF